MTLTELFSIYASRQPALWRLIDGRSETAPVTMLRGLSGSARALVAGAAFRESGRTMLAVLDDAEQAGYFYNDLTKVLGDEEVFFFPSSYRRAMKHRQTDAGNEVLRVETLNRLNGECPCVVVSSPDALAERVISTEALQERTIMLRAGERIDVSFLVDMLVEYGFERVEFVYEPGQFSQRGGIVDVFSFSHEVPYRIDFFGDEIDSIRTFEIENQLSRERKSEVYIVPNVLAEQAKMVSFFEFLKSDSLLLFSDFAFAAERVKVLAADAVGADGKFAGLVLSGEEFAQAAAGFQRIELAGAGVAGQARNDGNKGAGGNGAPKTVEFRTAPQPIFHKNFDLVSRSFRQSVEDGYTIYILSDSGKQLDRIGEILNEELRMKNEESVALTGVERSSFTPVLNTLHEGFVDHELKWCVYTDHQIFDRFHKFSLKSERARAGKVAMTLKELNQLQVSDFVVHIDHGIGRFGGLVQLNVEGRRQEAVKLLFRDDDVVMVNIHNLHRISKYKGKEGEPPRLNKLGTGAWQSLKERTKRKVKDIARDLIQLYAKRRAEQGFAFGADGYLQQELEASFLYEDTPDQAKATAAVKKDMESAVPMDRLVCGDVGFGKTEVAIRAAFKAAVDGKQTAVLVPTTVLAFQHFKTFGKRLRDLPVRVDYISRARKPADVKAILRDLSEGKIDILIGTHRVIGKDVRFKDLGLLVIDEEQKFGVSTKERLKQLRVNVDTLTLTATPIPRTLQFSLMGARDLSVMTTPPPNRYPVLTELHEWNEEVIREAIVAEMNRNGQVFFINNRVHNIETIAETVRRLVPEARVAVGHGQMESEQLERIITDFVDYEYDVLVATTIVESGIDIPNANTIIINSAQHFGLSDLHQLRGRVGRSNRKAYCYLLSPPLALLAADARRRLQAIENFSDLGSGFHIAMQDLDIRGAGNMLGAEQSGFIADLGYETYLKILNEAVSELKMESGELKIDGVNQGSNDFQLSTFNSQFTLETDLELLLPAVYVESVSERMLLYRELDGIADEAALAAFRARLIDRFGALPAEAEELLAAVSLRFLASRLGFERLVLKGGKLAAYLAADPDSSYYQSDLFGSLLGFVSANPRTTRLVERAGKRFAVLDSIGGVREAIEVLETISKDL